MSQWRVREVMTKQVITATDLPGRLPNANAHVGGFDGDINGDIVDEWGRQSFPASDPPANW